MMKININQHHFLTLFDLDSNKESRRMNLLLMIFSRVNYPFFFFTVVAIKIMFDAL